MKAQEFDKKFDDGEDIGDMLDLSKAEKVTLKASRVNIEFPNWMIRSLDNEASRIGVTRQSIIKMFIAEKLETLRQHL